MVDTKKAIEDALLVQLSNQQVEQFISDSDAERALLGAVLYQPECYYAAIKYIDHQSFYHIRHGYIWKAITALVERGEGIDMITVLKEMERTGDIQYCYDGANAPELVLSNLVGGDFTIANVERYAQIIAENRTRNLLVVAGNEITRMAVNRQIAIGEVIETMNKKLRGATASVAVKMMKSMEQASSQHWDKVDDAMNAGGAFGIPTGIVELDRIIGNLRKQKVYRFASRLHNGKSAVLLSIALNVAAQGKKVAFFAVEGTMNEVYNALAAMEMNIESERLESGNITQDEYKLYVHVNGMLSRLPLFIDDSDYLTPGMIYTRADALKAIEGLDVIIVDYDQAMEGRPKDNDYQRNTYIAQMCEVIAHKLDVPYVCASQVGRSAVKTTKDKRPNIWDIEGSDKYGQKAHVVVMGHYEAYYDPTYICPQRLELNVVKNKVTGKRGLIHAQIDKVTRRVTDEPIPNRSIDIASLQDDDHDD